MLGDGNDIVMYEGYGFGGRRRKGRARGGQTAARKRFGTCAKSCRSRGRGFGGCMKTCLRKKHR